MSATPPPPPPPSSGEPSGPPDAPPTAPPPPPSADGGSRPVPSDAGSSDVEADESDPADAPPALPGDQLAGGDAAQLHRTERTRTYPCRACGGELHFHIPSQGLACAHCGNRQEITDSAPTPQEQDLRAAVAALRTGDLGDGPQVEGEHEVVCQNCGGHTTFTGSLTATRCPYCATPIQRDDVHDAPSRLPVDGVVPFRVDQATANGHIDEWINSRWFAPNAFKKYSETGSFTSLYCAYFTYDAVTRSWYRGQRGDAYTVTVGHGENRRTETRIRWTRVSGRVANDFDDVAVLANSGLDRRYTAELEPWPTQTAKGFSPEYVAGHLARTYDHDVEESFVEAKQRIDAAIEHSVRRDIGGDQQRVEKVDTEYSGLTYKHLLLPVWLLTVLFAGETYQVFINGVTGEVQGQRPWSKVKIALAVIAALIVVGVVVVFTRGQG